MIYTTYSHEHLPGNLRPGVKDGAGELIFEAHAVMPSLHYYQGLEEHGRRRERFTAALIRNMRVWRMWNWEPEAAERVLHYIKTGSWDMAVVRERARSLDVVRKQLMVPEAADAS